jgi:hydroxymethylglutaryl-CoA reductase
MTNLNIAHRRLHNQFTSQQTFGSRRHFLMGAAATVGSAILAACGGSSAGSPNCDAIKQIIAYDNSQIQKLQQQEVGVTNLITLSQIQTQITGFQQDISTRQQQAKQQHCP